MTASCNKEEASQATGPSIPPSVANQLCTRLSQSSGLVLPAHVIRSLEGPPSAPTQLVYLSALLQKDPSIFLERHGRLLTESELGLFQTLAAADYEVAFYIKQIQQQRHPPPSLVKNRRYAQMKRLMAQGSFFGDEALRSRDPVLFHQMIGQYQPTVAPAKTGRLSTDILSQYDQAAALSQAQQQQASTAASQRNRDEIFGEQEEEEEDDSDSNDELQAVPQKLPVDDFLPSISGQELQDNRDELMRIMQTRFLQGADKAVCYDEIDNDALGLDDDNAAEADRDALESHFDAID